MASNSSEGRACSRMSVAFRCSGEGLEPSGPSRPCASSWATEVCACAIACGHDALK